MPSRAVTSFLPQIWQKKLVMLKTSCQCPLGLLPHFYLVSAADTQRPVCQKCQCPLGLLPHFYCSTPVEIGTEIKLCVNALSGCYLISTLSCAENIRNPNFKCQCPLGLLPHFYVKNTFEHIFSCFVSMPSRAVTSFLRYLRLLERSSFLCVNALSGCYLISTLNILNHIWHRKLCVNALSGCYLISTCGRSSSC